MKEVSLVQTYEGETNFLSNTLDMLSLLNRGTNQGNESPPPKKNGHQEVRKQKYLSTLYCEGSSV
jgi:hypothetical protein